MARVVLAQIEFARAICGSRKILPMLVMVQVTQVIIQTTIFCKDNRPISQTVFMLSIAINRAEHVCATEIIKHNYMLM